MYRFRTCNLVTLPAVTNLTARQLVARNQPETHRLDILGDANDVR